MLTEEDLIKFIENIKQFTPHKLCEIIVTARYLGSMREEAIKCMEELARRRENGDTFQYESFIDQMAKKLPNFKVNLQEKMSVGFNFTKLKGSI